MKNQKLNARVQKLLGAGLFILTFPFLFHEFIKLNDFTSGFLRGFGITLMMSAVFIYLKNAKSSGKTIV